MIRNHRLMRFMGITPKTVVHVGSHHGQDNAQYELLGIDSIYWCEADPVCASQIRLRYPKSYVVEGVFWSEANKSLDFWLMPNPAHNSLFEPKFFAEDTQRIQVKTTTLDYEFHNLIIRKPTLLVLDVQGAELEVLQGANKFLSKINFLICEITDESTISTFSVTRREIEELLTPLGFKKSISRRSHSGEYYDQLFVRLGKKERLRIRLFDILYQGVRVLRFLRLKLEKLFKYAQ